MAAVVAAEESMDMVVVAADTKNRASRASLL